MQQFPKLTCLQSPDPTIHFLRQALTDALTRASTAEARIDDAVVRATAAEAREKAAVERWTAAAAAEEQQAAAAMSWAAAAADEARRATDAEIRAAAAEAQAAAAAEGWSAAAAAARYWAAAEEQAAAAARGWAAAAADVARRTTTAEIQAGVAVAESRQADDDDIESLRRQLKEMTAVLAQKDATIAVLQTHLAAKESKCKELHNIVKDQRAILKERKKKGKGIYNILILSFHSC
jgi:hypothetical protein